MNFYLKEERFWRRSLFDESFHEIDFFIAQT